MEVDVWLNNEGVRYPVGRLDNRDGTVVFQYTADFIKKGLEISPLRLPLQSVGWRSSDNLFNGLPGVFSDSLPDGWGNLLLDRKLRQHGRRLLDVSPLERLCWIGNHGMGALEYEPATGIPELIPDDIRLDAIAEDADAVLAESASPAVLDDLCGMNGSSGGARPKIVCLVSDDFQTIRRGHLTQAGFSPWIIKFRQQIEKKDAGAQEFICLKIAEKAGINVPDHHLFESSAGPGWLGVKRFDRTESGKRHMATVAGLLHCDFRQPSLDYESLMALAKALSGIEGQIEMFRRTVLNFILHNCDDHAKNFSYVMDAQGQWALSPIYDVTPDGMIDSEHMTALSGKGSRVTRKDFMALATRFDISEKTAQACIDQAVDALAGYPEYAKELGVKVPAVIRESIGKFC